MKFFVTMPRGEVRDSFIPAFVAARMESMGTVRWNETPENLSEADLVRELKDTEAVVCGWGSQAYNKRILEACPSLRAILYTGGSVATVATEDLYDAGIPILSGNEIYAESVAESVICYVLTMLRDIPRFTDQIQRLGWAQNGWKNEGLIGQKVGLIGFGAVARYTAKLLRAFRCEIYICADHVTEAEAADYGAKKASMEEIFSSCKVVSLHLAKTPETYHVINRRLMSMLRPDAILVNTARGAIIDEAAMADLLIENRFRAALDVYEEEPLPMTSRLRGLENALLIPHMGGPTLDRRPFVTCALLDELPRALSGKQSYLEISREAMRRMTR